MGIVDGLMKTAQAASAVSTLHQNAKYLYNEAQKALPENKPCTTCPKKLSIVGPDTGVKDQWIRFTGTSPPGILTLYSQVHPETKPFYPDPKTGVWQNFLYFTKAGRYEVVVKNNDLSAKCYITITE